MRHVSYRAQADDLLIAALHGDTKAKQVLTEVVADLPGQLFSESLDEATIRLLMQRALNGDQAAQKRVATLLAPLVVPPSQTFAVCEDTSPPDIREFSSWDEALAFARALAKQSPDAYVTIHPQPKKDRVHYRIHSSGEVEKIDLSKYGL
jgi:hypothetical protein